MVLDNDLGVVEDNNSNKHNYKYKVNIKNIKLPIKKNSVIGEVIINEKNKEKARSNLIVTEDIGNINYLGLFTNSLKELISGNY